MTADDFSAWRENPVTQYFLTALSRIADANEAEVRQRAWDAARAGQAGHINAESMNALAIKADAYRQIADPAFEDIQAFHEDTND